MEDKKTGSDWLSGPTIHGGQKNGFRLTFRTDNSWRTEEKVDLTDRRVPDDQFDKTHYDFVEDEEKVRHDLAFGAHGAEDDAEADREGDQAQHVHAVFHNLRKFDRGITLHYILNGHVRHSYSCVNSISIRFECEVSSSFSTMFAEKAAKLNLIKDLLEFWPICDIFGQRSMANAQWPMLNGQCSMANAQWPMLNNQMSTEKMPRTRMAANTVDFWKINLASLNQLKSRSNETERWQITIYSVMDAYCCQCKMCTH